MRGARQVISLALLAVCAGACDTTQPLQQSEQTFALGVKGVGSSVPVYNVYDMFRDNDGDDVADDVDGDGDGDLYLWCKRAFETNVPPGQPPVPISGSPSSLPIGYTIEVTILRAGTTERETITSPAATTNDVLNRTEYDTFVVFGSVLTEPPITESGQTYKFTNGRRLSAANIEVAAATSNPLSSALPSIYNLENGLCSRVFYGPAVIDEASSTSYPLVFVLEKGDTVTVKAVRAVDPLPDGVPIDTPASVALIATLSLDGRPVTVSGSFVSDPGPAGQMVFSYTSK